MNSNSYQNQKERGLKRKYEYILSRGGKCEKCGYNKNLAALDFHHINPQEKEFAIDARKFANGDLSKLKKELDKCTILCANCHREIHHPDMEMNNLSDIINSDKKSFSSPRYKSVCPVCKKEFKNTGGKIYCSQECKENKKNYPSKVQVEFQYSLLHSWQKVANYFGLTRRIIQGIRNK